MHDQSHVATWQICSLYSKLAISYCDHCISIGVERHNFVSNPVSNPHTGFTVSHEVPHINLSDRPKLPMFTSFPAQSGKFINIVQRIGAKYQWLGTHLLNDDTGSRTESMLFSGPQATIHSILSSWLQGGGKEPVTWATFINVLKQIGLSELAKELGK